MVPKFRAWDKESRQMCNVGALYSSRDYEIELVSVHLHSGLVINRNLGNCILMQSTGLKDKNGVEIFEGDILIYTAKSVNYSDTYWHSYCEVFRAHNGAYRIRGEHICETDLYSNRNHVTVAGNIYDTPELLKKERLMTSTADPELLEAE